MAILKDLAEKIKCCAEEYFFVAIIILIGFLCFGLGRLSKIEEMRPPIEVENETASLIDASPLSASAEAYFIASKNGTKYYFPWCSGAQKISPANLVKFATREEAEKAGLTKASNCAGL